MNGVIWLLSCSPLPSSPAYLLPTPSSSPSSSPAYRPFWTAPPVRVVSLEPFPVRAAPRTEFQITLLKPFLSTSQIGISWRRIDI